MSFTEAVFEASCYNTGQLIESNLPEIVFSGRSNVGKSSMINKLLGRKKLARVSSAPGKTASINFYLCGGFRLVDLPGYGFARVSMQEKEKWSELVVGYLSQKRSVALVIQLVDARRAPTQDDADMIGYLEAYRLPFVIAATKSDKLSKSELIPRIHAAPEETGQPEERIVFFSSRTGFGLPELEKLINESIAGV